MYSRGRKVTKTSQKPVKGEPYVISGGPVKQNLRSPLAGAADLTRPLLGPWRANNDVKG